MAAELPSSTKNSVYIQPSVEIFQSQSVTNSSWKKPTSGPQGTGALMPTACESGSQNTEKP